MKPIQFLPFHVILTYAVLLLIEPTQAKVVQILQSPNASNSRLTNASSVAQAELEEYPEEETELQDFSELTKNTQKSSGLFTTYRQTKTGKIYLEVQPNQLNKNYLAIITMESGIGEQNIYSGMPLNNFIFYFRRANNNLLFTMRNVKFRTRSGDPQAGSVNRAFSDSVLLSIPIRSIHPQKNTMLIDLGDLLLKDLPDLKMMLAESLGYQYSLDRKKTYFDNLKAFPLNLEIDTVYGFSFTEQNNSSLSLSTVPDYRSLNIRVHYSLSELPENNGYVPRLADDRVGYLTTVYRDFSNLNGNSQLVRYINRWHLEKQDPNAPLSPPKKPIVFWIENTTPLEYREAIKEGALMWNKAFEKAGFKNAIEVKQMPDNADWKPGDRRYNTIRWLNSLDKDIAYGLSRTNPLTGEVLDSDILIDANMVQDENEYYQIFLPPRNSNKIKSNDFCLPFNRLQSRSYRSLQRMPNRSFLATLIRSSDVCYGRAIANQFVIGAMALSLLPDRMSNHEEKKEYIAQFLRWLVAHEVGHTLGLRHNFRASFFLKPEELNNTEITRTRGMVSSVMDYAPINLAPLGTKQGDYSPAIVGPYDEWAIEYGYTPSGFTNPQNEKQLLQKIIQKQSTNPELSYAPDEDSSDLDPTSNRGDLSSDPLRYAQWQLDNARLMWESLNKSDSVKELNQGELKKMFDRVFSYYYQQLKIISKYIGGQSFYRDRINSSNRSLPLEVVSVEKQKEALVTLQKYLFAEDAFNFPPEIWNKLTPSQPSEWDEEGINERLDYPIHDEILSYQSDMLRSLLSGDRLTRLRDIELKTPPGKALTIPELFNFLQNGIWSEVLQAEKKSVKISSLRRALQRDYLAILIDMVLRTEEVPEDARSLAWQKLRQLRESLNSTLRKQGKSLDDYTRAHLEETRDRITKVLDAPLRSD